MKEIYCNWPIACLLGKYFEENGVPFKIIKDSKVDLDFFPLYYNDPIEGMCGQYLRKVTKIQQSTEFEPTRTYFVTDVGRIEKTETFSEFMTIFANRYENFKNNILELKETMIAIGNEWKNFVANDYKISPKQTPHLLKFYNKNFFEYINECPLPEELKFIFKSLFPKEDISFNNGSAYIVTQIFDSKCSLKLTKSLISDSIFTQMVDESQHETDEKILIIKVGRPEKVNNYVSFVGNCSGNKSYISYFGLEILKTMGITQVILAEQGNQVQIDVYQNGCLKDEELLDFIGTFIDLSNYENMIAHRSDYNPENWAFSAKEAMKNPFKKGQESLYHFGAAYFTAAMYMINELEGDSSYVKNSD